MDSQPSALTLGLLPEPRTRWGKFVLSYSVQSAVAAFFVIAAIMHPDVLEPRERDYHFVSLASTPPPVPQTPAPVKHFPAPTPKIVEPVIPRPEAMRVPSAMVCKKLAGPEVASTGFGSGDAPGNSSGTVPGSRGAVRQGGFGDADVVAASQPKTKSAEPVVKTLPAEITFKPRPVYTDEGRQLKIEGEVLLDVVFSATGQIRVVKVMHGLGHGLDESAVRAAEKIQFKPALRDGHPADFEAVLHIVFQLTS